MGETHGYFEGIGGLRVFYRVWEVRGACGSVLLVHGLGDHSGRYERTASTLNGAGFSVYALDMRGHGRSQGRRGHVRAFDHLLQDLDRLRRRVCAGTAARRPVFLLGVSLGGLVVLRYLQEFGAAGIRGAVAVAPFFDLVMPVPGWKLRLGRVADRLAPALSLDSGLDSELLFREENEREWFRQDPLTHRRVSARMWGEMRRAASAIRQRPEEIGAAVLLQLPGEDLVVDGAVSEKVSRRFVPDVQVRQYPDALHDLYRDPAGAKAIADAVAWLRTMAPAQAQAAS